MVNTWENAQHIYIIKFESSSKAGYQHMWYLLYRNYLKNDMHTYIYIYLHICIWRLKRQWNTFSYFLSMLWSQMIFIFFYVYFVFSTLPTISICPSAMRKKHVLNLTYSNLPYNPSPLIFIFCLLCDLCLLGHLFFSFRCGFFFKYLEILGLCSSSYLWYSLHAYEQGFYFLMTTSEVCRGETLQGGWGVSAACFSMWEVPSSWGSEQPGALPSLESWCPHFYWP